MIICRDWFKRWSRNTRLIYEWVCFHILQISRWIHQGWRISRHYPYVKRSWLSAEQLAVITICIKAVAMQGWRGRPSSYVSHGGDAKRFSHVRTLSLRAGSRCGERVWEKREGHANRRLHVCHPPSPRFLHPQASRARCFLIPWPNSLCRGETLIDIPLLRFERGISRARNYLPERYRYLRTFSVDVDRVEKGGGLFFIFARKWRSFEI